MIPVVGILVGVTLNAVLAFALTFGIGQAACVYLGMVKAGQVIDKEKDSEGLRGRHGRSLSPQTPRRGCFSRSAFMKGRSLIGHFRREIVYGMAILLPWLALLPLGLLWLWDHHAVIWWFAGAAVFGAIAFAARIAISRSAKGRGGSGDGSRSSSVSRFVAEGTRGMALG